MKKMSNWLNTNSFNEKDEYYTPSILVKPILNYIKPNSVIWCPFDTENSEFVILLKEAGHKVIYSHIWLGQDFFNYEPLEHYDYIISNLPFSKKLEVFKRLYELGKPFAMICSTFSELMPVCTTMPRSLSTGSIGEYIWLLSL